MPTKIEKSKDGLTAVISTEIDIARAEERDAEDLTKGILYAGVEALEAAIKAHVSDSTEIDAKIAELEAQKAALPDEKPVVTTKA